MAYYRTPTMNKEDIIKKINNGEITDYDNIEWLSLFKVNSYYDIRTELFDRIDKQYWKPVLKAFVEAVELSSFESVKKWRNGYGKECLGKIKKEVDKQTEQSEPEQKVEPQQIELGSIHTKVHGELKYLERGGTLDKIYKIHEYLIKTNTIDTNLNRESFIFSIRRADLGEIYSNPNTKRSNFLYAVWIIKRGMKSGWLENVLASMNINKKQFDGRHPEKDFTKGFPKEATIPEVPEVIRRNIKHRNN